MSDRKYKQRGYQDSEREPKRDASVGRPAQSDWTGPRRMAFPDRRNVHRCAGCGALLASDTDFRSRCPRCGFELHSCKQCAHFDPSSRFQCTRPIAALIARKDARNECAVYETRVTIERETSSAGSRPLDAKAAFESLFKK